ncbi:MAG: sugar transferase [Chloroflexi bacterium]|nr:sugar transferase [Chloroflexota bacterium]
MDQTQTFPSVRFPQTPIFDWSRARLDRFAKRAFDIVAALVGLVALSPFLLLVVVLIRREGAGPVLYRGQRAGKDDKNFGILKFRTMRETPDAHRGPRVTAQDDPRITPLGRWLRDTKLNELPQLWNVLVGEMSLVGPRPEDPEIVAGWDEDVRGEVLSVRPGITSPASVQYRNEESLLHAGSVMETYLGSILPSKLRLDQLYVRHRTFMVDLDVLFWTAMVLLPQWRTFAPPEELLIFGPLRRLVRRYLNWFVVDALITLAAIALAGAIERSQGPLDLGLWKASVIAFGFSLLFGATSALLGMYRVAWSQASDTESLGLVMAAALACGCALALNQFTGDPLLLPPSMIVVGSTLALIGSVALRYRGRLVDRVWARGARGNASTRLARERVLIVGSGYAGQFMTWLLSHGPSADAFHVVGFADDDLYKQGIRINGVTVLGRRGDIPRLVAKHDIGIIVFAIHNVKPLERMRLLDICASAKARVVMAPDIMGALNEVRTTSVEFRNASFKSPDASRELDPCQVCLMRGEKNGRNSWVERRPHDD